MNQIAELFGRDKSVISRHIKNIFKTNELQMNSVVAKIATTAKDGKVYQVDYYNLDMILSVGYRVDSQQATQFRIWATKILKQHLLEGYTINKKQLVKNYQKFKKTSQLPISLTPEALTALTLLIAESNSKDKMIGLVLLLLQKRKKTKYENMSEIT